MTTRDPRDPFPPLARTDPPRPIYAEEIIWRGAIRIPVDIFLAGRVFETQYVTVRPQIPATADEGGEIALIGEGANPQWFIDVFGTTLRLRNEGSGTAIIHRINGAEVVRFTADTPGVYQETVYFTSSGTFTKADYPGLKAIRARVQGGGGAGGGAAATAASGEFSAGAGGNGGNYAESFILAADLDTAEAVTVGAGGTGGTGNGPAGGTSSIDTISGSVTATGGLGGAIGNPNSGWLYGFSATTPSQAGCVGDLIIPGQPGDHGGSLHSAANDHGFGGPGGGSFLGRGTTGHHQNASAAGGAYGGGGGGAGNAAGQAARAGGSGAAGIVIVDVYV